LLRPLPAAREPMYYRRPAMRRCAKAASSLVLASLFAGACSSDGPYFGRTTPPDERRLIYGNTVEPESLDPHKMSSSMALRVSDALFEGLVKYHPQTLEPMAAIATHYETNADSSQFTFFLRGHPSPRGTKLPNTDTLTEDYRAGRLAEDFTRGHHAPPDSVPARWSDGALVTAHDFVYAWRRAVDPKTAADYASLVYYVKNAEEINAGKAGLRAEDLAVRAQGDFAFQVDLRAPAAFFPKLLPLAIYAPTPRQAIEAAKGRGLESSWTQPENIVTNGAFRLARWLPYDEIVVTKSPTYYEADLVDLDRIVFLPVAEQTTHVNLYKAGHMDAMASNWIPQAFVGALRRKADFYASPALATYYLRFNTTRPPFDDVRFRYALNMALDKQVITDFLGGGELPARSSVPPLKGYEAPATIPVTLGGKTYDVLAYDPEAAREMLAHAGLSGGVKKDGGRRNIELLTTSAERDRQLIEIVQQQWQQHLGIEVTLRTEEPTVVAQTLTNLQYAGALMIAWYGDYADPNTFLDIFMSRVVTNATGWSDPAYDAMVTEANATLDPAPRLKKLAASEARLLAGMPFSPMFFASNVGLKKPYVRGLVPTPNDNHPFKYVSIDAGWKPGSDGVARRGSP
jgi:oligopeptide transport system substrate-binding protein